MLQNTLFALQFINLLQNTCVVRQIIYVGQQKMLNSLMM